MNKEKLIDELIKKNIKEDETPNHKDFYILGLSSMYDNLSDKLSAKDEAISNLNQTISKLRSDINSRTNELERIKKLSYGYQAENIAMIAVAKHFGMTMRSFAQTQEINFFCEVFIEDLNKAFNEAISNLKIPVIKNDDSDLPF